MLAARKVSCARPVLPAQRVRVASRVVCKAQNDEGDIRKTVALPIAAMVAAALLGGAMCPDEALAARSSGRAGGSSGFSSRKFSRPAPAPATRSSVSSTTVVVAPPVFSPFGFSPFGGGYGYGGGFLMPFPVFGGLFQFIFLAMIISVVFNVIRGMAAAASSSTKRKDDDDQWGSL